MEPARHLYVHVPFCAHRCGYCDFVTVTGARERHAPYVEALLAELRRGRTRDLVAERPETVYLGGGTPTLLGPELLARLLDALPAPQLELTVECNPETATPELAAVLAARGARVSLGAQTFDAGLLRTLERRADPATVERAVATLRAAGVRDLSLDLIFGVPGETTAILEHDLDRLVALAPDHVSAYELEAKPGTRFAIHHGAALAAQEELVEEHMERVVERLEAAGYRWYETASFARDGREGRHNRAYWEGRDYLGIGVGAVSTLGATRRANGPRLAAYLDALAHGAAPPAQLEPLDAATRLLERLMLGLRLAEGVPRALVEPLLDAAEVERMAAHGLLVARGDTIALTRRGRMLGGGVTARIVSDANRS